MDKYEVWLFFQKWPPLILTFQTSYGIVPLWSLSVLMPYIYVFQQIFLYPISSFISLWTHIYHPPMVLSTYRSFPANLSLNHIFRLAQYNYFIFFILLLPRSQMLRHFVSLEMRFMEEHDWLSGLQEEAALWLWEAELACDKSEAALVQSSEDKCMSRLFTCETPIYSCKIYFLWTFYLYMTEDLKLQL